jgi:hypothetical protein
MFRVAHQPLAARIVVEIVKPLPPESFALQRDRLPVRLPEPTLAIGRCLISQRLNEALWTLCSAIIAEVRQNVRLSATILYATSDTNTGSHSTTEQFR